MGRAHSWKELGGMTRAELIEEHDRHAKDGGADFLQTIRDELRYREQARQTCTMIWMTVVITLATIANVVLWGIK